MKAARRVGPWLLSAALHAALGAVAWVTVVGMPEGEKATGLSPDTDASYEVVIRPGGAPTIGDAPKLADRAYGPPEDSVVLTNAQPDAVPDLPNATASGPRLVVAAPPGTGLPARSYERGAVAVFPAHRGGGGGPAPGAIAAGNGGGGTGTGTGKGTGEGKDEGIEAVPLETPPPAYPDAARRGNVEGVVIAELQIDKQGRVESARAAQGSGSALLDDAVIAAVRGWRYRPATLRGAPISSIRRVRFEFRLE